MLVVVASATVVVVAPTSTAAGRNANACVPAGHTLKKVSAPPKP
jgi:hypothetical protein